MNPTADKIVSKMAPELTEYQDGRPYINYRGGGIGGAGGAIAPPIFLEIGKILAFSTPNISISKEVAC